MTWNRYVLGVVALLVAGSLMISTSGFSTAAADRNVDAVVVPDDRAYLAIERKCSGGALQVIVTNRFSGGEALDVNIIVNGTSKTIDSLAAGHQGTKRFETFDIGDRIRIDASGSEISVQLTRPLPTGC